MLHFHRQQLSLPNPGRALPEPPLGMLIETKFVDGLWCVRAATCLSCNTRIMLSSVLPTSTRPFGNSGLTLWSSNERVPDCLGTTTLGG